MTWWLDMLRNELTFEKVVSSAPVLALILLSIVLFAA